MKTMRIIDFWILREFTIVAFVLVIGAAEQAQADIIETDAWSFATQPAFCGDGSHTVQAEDVLVVKGGQGQFAADDCTVTMLDRSEIRIAFAELSGSGELLIRADTGARQALQIRDSSLAMGRVMLHLLTDKSEIECVGSDLRSNSHNIGLHSGPMGETELRGCELRSDGPPPYGSNVFVSNLRDGTCQIKDSHLISPRGHIFVFRGPQAGSVRFEVK